MGIIGDVLVILVALFAASFAARAGWLVAGRLIKRN